MKAIITIFILLTATIFCNAQYQSIFGQYSTQWIFEWYNLNFGGHDTVYVEKDTTAFGHDWKKIRVSYFTEIEALLREDTTTGKVWYKSLYYYTTNPYPPDTVVRLCYDFSLQPNDSFDLSSIYSNIGFRKVDTVYIENGSRHVGFNLPDYPGVGTITFIEGIGGTPPPIWKQLSGIFGLPYLLCSYKDGIRTNYINKKYNGNCSPPLSIEETERLKKAINISPNPADNFIQFEIKDGLRISNYDVFDLQGRKMFVAQNRNSIDVSDLSSGFYFIQFTTDENIKINKIFIKH